MEMRYLADQIRYQRMNTSEIRETFLVENLFKAGKLSLLYTEADRAIVGSAVPGSKELSLSGAKELAAEYFAQRREIGIINIGSAGQVIVDGNAYPMQNRDGLYIGRGAKKVTFSSKSGNDPAAFYILSYPAHTAYPNMQVTKADAIKVDLGSAEAANKRTIYKYILPEKMKTCQLVMGITELEDGSIWNTMAAHTHERRTEIYMYFDMKKEDVVFHFMGKPDETRHLAVRNRQAVLSPSWSIHAGAGTGSYTFIWAMGGENQAFDDMDFIDMDDIQ